LRNILAGWTMTAVILLITITPVTAATLADVDFDDNVTVAGKELVLNGLGMTGPDPTLIGLHYFELDQDSIK
jgi:hypothetical protein